MNPSRPALFLSLAFLVFAMPLAAQAEKDDASNVVATYQVQDGVLIGSADPDHRTIWSTVQGLIPGPLLSMVDTLEFFQVPESMKDEEIGTDAYAVLNENGTTFTLGLNLDSALSAFVDLDPENRPLFEQTVLHEFGHVLSFQPSQRDESETVTGTLVIEEGTLLPHAYLNLFYEKFWKKAFPHHGVETASDAEGAALFRQHPSSFVTEYAATGPLEDFAETFSFFVTEPSPRGKSVRDQKLRFFAAFPELEALRDQMRQGL